MKKTLGYKSTSEIVATIIIIILSFAAALSILMYYKFVFTDIADAVQIILYAFLLIMLVSIVQFFVLINNPKIMLEYDDELLYYYKSKKKTIEIAFKNIQNIYAKVSIWTKPFVVYTAIVIMIENKTYYLRHITKMNEVKDVIQHIAYHE